MPDTRGYPFMVTAYREVTVIPCDFSPGVFNCCGTSHMLNPYRLVLPVNSEDPATPGWCSPPEQEPRAPPGHPLWACRFWALRSPQSPLSLIACRAIQMWVRSLGQEDPLEKETATQFSVLVWRIPGTGALVRRQGTHVSMRMARRSWSSLSSNGK